MRSLKLSLAALMLSVAPSLAEPKVTVSIKPIHSLVSALMDGVAEPSLLIDGAASPHDFALKPSDAQQLQSADIVVWVGHNLEGFLEKPLETIAKNAISLELLDAEGIKALPFREGGHDDHDHGAKKHDDHDDHADHKKHEGHDHDKHKGHEDHDDHDKHKDHAKKDSHAGHGHEEGSLDPHIWLDPDNAKAIAHAVLDVLIKQDPANKAAYQANHDKLHLKLDALEAELEEMLHPVEGKPFVVFHDAYQYFEGRFDLNHRGSVTLNPEIAPSANHIKELKAEIAESQAICAFSEPQFPAKFVTLLQEGTSLKTAVLDPLGMSVAKGVDHYPEMMRSLATQFKECLN